MKLIHSEDIKAIHLRGENIINKTINVLLFVKIFTVIVVTLFAQIVFADNFVSNTAQTDIRNAPKGTPTVLIDIPGVGWTGNKREGDWGHLLQSFNNVTIYVKHKGSKYSWNKWDASIYDHVVTLPDNKKEALDKKLLPIMKNVMNQGKDIHIIIDKNITFSRHVTTGKKGEDKWAAGVADYVLGNVPKNYFKMQAMHSNGTITPAYMKNTEKLDYAIIASPRGEKGLELAKNHSDMPIDIITGLSDAPSLRLPGSKGKLLKENPNLRIIELQEGNFLNFTKWGKTHGKLQNTMLEGKWKVLEGDTKKEFKGALGQILAPKIHLYSSAEKSRIPSYWTQSNRNQSMTEAQIMTEMTHGKKKALIVGNGPEADLMYKNMTNRLGEGNVKWSKQDLGRQQLQLQARKFGADVILGTKEYGPFTKKYRPLASASVYTGSVSIDGPKIYDAGSHTPPDLPDKMSKAGAGFRGAQERMKEALKHSHDINKVRNPGAYGFPGKPGSFIPTDIGGVMLQGAADVSDATDAGTQLTDGTFSLIFQNANAEIDIGKLRKFVTALWAVYFSEEGPGISIDPIAPGVDKHLVRYIGRKVINSDLGRVMREADYAMKKWAVGIERPDIDGFKSVDALTAQHGLRYIGASRRFWFVPEDMRFKRAGDAVLFDSGEMTLKTEYVLINKEVRSEPADKDFAQFFTQKYDEIAEKYPVYRELFEYAKLVSLARYLKDKGIPMLWFLLANKDMVITENSPGTVDALAKKSDYYEYIMIEGGVDLDIKLSEVDYVFDMEATKAINKAYKLYGTNSLGKSSVLPSESITFETKDNDFTLTPSHILALSNGTVTGDKYQTDIAVRYGKGPGLELARYYNPEYKGPATFGKGWHLLIPYRVETHGKGKIEFGNAIIPEKMVVKNLLTGRKEVLAFSKDRYSIAGYVPDDLENSSFIGLFLLSDASFRLADKLGNEFQFNQGGHLIEMVFSKEYHVKLEYGYAESKKDEFSPLPYRIEPVTDKYEEFTNVRLPKNMRVVDVINGKKEVFVFNNKNKYKIAGYTPLNENNSKYKILAIMTDGSYDLIDKQGNEVSFDPAGRLNRIRARVIKGLSQGNYKIKFDYEFNNGGPGIKEAHVLKGDQSTALYAIKYKYDNDGRLCKVFTPAGKDMEIKYDEERVIVAMK
jgi:YD repeat-containing protein